MAHDFVVAVDGVARPTVLEGWVYYCSNGLGSFHVESVYMDISKLGPERLGEPSFMSSNRVRVVVPARVGAKLPGAGPAGRGVDVLAR